MNEIQKHEQLKNAYENNLSLQSVSSILGMMKRFCIFQENNKIIM